MYQVVTDVSTNVQVVTDISTIVQEVTDISTLQVGADISTIVPW